MLHCPWDFSRQEYWSGLPIPSPGDLPNLGIKPTSLASHALTGVFFISWVVGEFTVWLDTIGINLYSLTVAVFVRLLHCEVTPPQLRFLYCTLWKKFIICTSHLGRQKLFSTLLNEEYLHKMFGILLLRIFVSFPYTFTDTITYLCQYGLKYMYLTLWIII